jgi:hypothetical protein
LRASLGAEIFGQIQFRKAEKRRPETVYRFSTKGIQVYTRRVGIRFRHANACPIDYEQRIIAAGMRAAIVASGGAVAGIPRVTPSEGHQPHEVRWLLHLFQ